MSKSGKEWKGDKVKGIKSGRGMIDNRKEGGRGWIRYKNCGVIYFFVF